MFNKTGVYKIVNNINGNTYYGSASIKFRHRLNDHYSLLNRNKHKNPFLQNAWNKYGQISFEFKIILICEPNECLYYEQLYLNKYWDNGNTCYNASKSAVAPMTGRKMSIETRRKMSRSATKPKSFQWRVNMSLAQKEASARKRKPAIERMMEHFAFDKSSAIRNKKQAGNTSGYVGVRFDKSRNKWMAYIKNKGIAVNLGRFDTLNEAIVARANGVIKYFTKRD